MERALVRLRAGRNWTQEEAAELASVDVGTYRKWEHGTMIPRASSIQRLCKVFVCSEAELGLRRDVPPAHAPALPESTEANETHLFLASDPTMCLLSLAFSPLSCYQIQCEVIKLLEGYPMNTDPLSRREALRRLATFPIVALHLNALTSTPNILPETVFAHCSAGIVACWYLRKSKELVLADSAISTYIPTLREIVTSSSHHRKPAADLLVQCYLLKTALSWHITSPLDGIGYAQQAEAYSQIAEKPLLQVAALRAQAAVLCYAFQWGQALHAGLQAKHVLESTPKDLIPPLARSYVYAGVATYQAYHQQKQDALTSLKKAHATFFEQSETDTVPLWIDHNIGNLLINDGLTHSHLGLYKGAVNSFAQVEQRYPQDNTISFSGTIEAQIEGVLAEVSRDDQDRDMEKCIALWTEGIIKAKSAHSNKHFGDALVAYTAMKAVWPGEGRIKQLREHTTHW